ncbi:Chromosome partition protein Smc [Carpediemonas membranifera]|uniref:Chromosome partition protein Smc n=1 Tax=Carpediemonas membranifera TaxID=201153 RepID=A0A8J6B8D4_9EUKA|nr:Chromosome partition protein Smc [Carpediemonas membranifera]|eukprot:KAG9395279.1 Chromosome partition protein Smc [Carpediemonas membranifera]
MSRFEDDSWYNIQTVIRSQFQAFYDTIEKQGKTIARLSEQVSYLRSEIRDKDSAIEQMSRGLVELNGRITSSDYNVARISESVAKMPAPPSKEDILDSLLVHIKREREAREQEEEKIKARVEDAWLRCQRLDGTIAEAKNRDTIIKRQLSELSEWKGVYADVKRDLEQHSVDPKELNTVLERKVDVEVLENIIDDLKAALAKKVDTITFSMRMDQADRQAQTYRNERDDLAEALSHHEEAQARKSVAAESMAQLSQQVGQLRSRVGMGRSPGAGLSATSWASPFASR